MKPEKIKVLNQFQEALDIWVEGLNNATETVVLVHGFGTDKHETKGEFDFLTKHLSGRFRIVRFDFSGYGLSEGNQDDGDYQKWADDLNSVLLWAHNNISGELNIIAQSMGCFVTAYLNPNRISRCVFISIPNSHTDYLIERMKSYFKAKGAKIDERGRSIFYRSSGKVQTLGPPFWRRLRQFRPVEAMTALAKKSKVLIIHPKQDEIVGNEYMSEYKKIIGLNYVEIDGNHSFSEPQPRKKLIETIMLQWRI